MSLRNTVIPFLATILIHVIVLSLFFVDWKTQSPRIKVKPPQNIKATLVDYKAKSKPAASKKQPKKVDLTKKQKQLEQQRRAEAAAAEKKLALKKKREQEQAKKIADEKAKQLEEKKRKEKQERERKKKLERELRKKQQQAEFDEALAKEQEMLLEQTYNEQAQSFAASIREQIRQKWSRPPSARTGMRCMLAISMLPSGFVVDVTIIQSSGNAAFDRSAVNAVKKVSTFNDVRNIPIELFEREFRQFKMLFNPEDLRQ